MPLPRATSGRGAIAARARDGAQLARAVDAALARLVDAVLPIRSGRELRAEGRDDVFDLTLANQI